MFPVEFLPDPLPGEPLEVAARWLAEATQRAIQPNPNAMVLATADAAGQPSARVVLCKEIVPIPGYVRFFTNYGSHKGREIATNPRAAIVMHWDSLHRQVRIEGVISVAPAAESNAYFASRPWQRRVAAWASEQSQPIASHAALVERVARTAARLHAPVPGPGDDPEPPGLVIARPPFWGGYHLWAGAVELWVEGESRVHDRARWVRTLAPAGEGFAPGPWRATRLQP